MNGIRDFLSLAGAGGRWCVKARVPGSIDPNFSLGEWMVCALHTNTPTSIDCELYFSISVGGTYLAASRVVDRTDSLFGMARLFPRYEALA